MRHLISLLFFILSAQHLVAQPSVLEKYLQMGIQQNLRLYKEALNLQDHRLAVEEARGKYLPTVSFEASYLLAEGGRSIEIPIGSLVNPIHRTLNELTGSNNFPTAIPNADEQLTPSNFHNTNFRVSQPLFNTSIYYNHKAREHQVSAQEARIAAFQSQLRKDIQVTYFNYLKTGEVLRIYDTTEVLLEEVLRFNEKLVTYDKATDDIVAAVEFELQKLESDRAELQQQRQVLQSLFNSYLNRNLDQPIEEETNTKAVFDRRQRLDELKKKALTDRHELRQVQEAIRAGQVLTELNEKSRLPTLGLEATVGFQGFGYAFSQDQFLVTLGIGLNWTIYEGRQRNLKIQRAQVQTQQLRKDLEMIEQQIEMQVIQAWYAVTAAERKLQAEEAAARSAKRSFDIIQRKYQNEQALLVEYLDGRTKFTNARIAVAAAHYDLLIRQAELERAIAL